MTQSAFNHKELMDLLNAVWDEGMDEASRAKIEDLLAQDPQAAEQLLVSYSRMHLDLEMLISSDSAHEKAIRSLKAEAANGPGIKQNRRLKVTMLTAAAAILVAVYSLWDSGPVGHEHLVRTPQLVGRVARLESATWADGPGLQTGSALVEGQIFDLEQGFAQLSMGFGADVLLQGPCRAQILANDRVALTRGKLGVRAAEWAVGFKVETDNLVATDLGTWFSVEAGTTVAQVHVLEGLVLADPVKASKRSSAGRRVTADEAVQVSTSGAMQSIEFRRGVAAEELKQFEPLQPVKIWNTGVNLGVGEQDPHWSVTGGDAKDGPYPQPAYVSSPHGSYGINEPRRSQWISVQEGTTDGAPARSKYTFETKFDLSGFDLGTVVISGLVLADDGVDEVRLNGELLDIKPWKDWGYGIVYNRFHPIEIQSGFVPGVNRISFVVKNETFINRSGKGFDLPETPNPMALRAEWQAFGRPLRDSARD